MSRAEVFPVRITLTEILQYLGQGNRPLAEGDRIFKSKHVVSAGAIRRDGNTIHVFGLVLQTTQPKSHPHEVTLKLPEGNPANWNCLCTCKAGLAHKCKHIFGMLVYLYNCDELRVATCTDVKQIWGRVKKDVEGNFSAKQVSDMCCVKSVSQNIATSDQQDHDNLHKFMQAPKSAMVLHKQKRHAMCKLRPPEPIECSAAFLSKMFASARAILPTILSLQSGCVKDFYLRRVRLERAGIEQIEQKTRLQNNETWAYERALRITASRAHALYTYKGKDWDLKVERFLRQSEFTSAPMQYGQNTEGIARICYTTTTKFAVAKVGLVINFDQPWLGCSPDGYNFAQDKLIEIKCPINGKLMPLADMLRTVKYIDENFNLKTNHMYYTQIQISLAVTNINCCDFVLYSKFDDKCHISTIYLDYELAQKIVSKLRNVYFNKLLPKIFEVNNN